MGAVNESSSHHADANIAIGYNSLTGGTLTDGNLSHNIAIGYEALDATGANDQLGTIAIGYAALGALTSGAGNTAVGYQCLDGTDDGALNTAVGYQSLSANCGNGNVAVGYRAGYGVTGALNILIGHQAGYDTVQLTSGTQNIVIGDNARTSAADSTNQVVIGRDAQGVGDNSVTLGNASILNVYAGSDGGAHVHCSGVSFPATQDASGGANVQDDYEEGGWTPVLSDGTNNATMNGGNASYVKIGASVTLVAHVSTSSLGSVSGNIRVTGLPFTNGATTTKRTAVSVGFGTGLAITAGTNVSGWIEGGGSIIHLMNWDITGGASYMQHSEWTDDGNVMINVTYSVV